MTVKTVKDASEIFFVNLCIPHIPVLQLYGILFTLSLRQFTGNFPGGEKMFNFFLPSKDFFYSQDSRESVHVSTKKSLMWNSWSASMKFAFKFVTRSEIIHALKRNIEADLEADLEADIEANLEADTEACNFLFSNNNKNASKIERRFLNTIS